MRVIGNWPPRQRILLYLVYYPGVMVMVKAAEGKGAAFLTAQSQLMQPVCTLRCSLFFFLHILANHICSE